MSRNPKRAYKSEEESNIGMDVHSDHHLLQQNVARVGVTVHVNIQSCYQIMKQHSGSIL